MISTFAAPLPTSSIDRSLAKPTSPGHAPKLRLSKPIDAYQIAATLVRAAIPRVDRGRMVRGLLDGRPPRSPSALRRQAQDWRANFNTLEGTSIVRNAKTPYYDLFQSTMPLVEPDLDSDDPQRDHWNEIAALEFHRFIYSYHSFESVLWSMLEDFIVFNKGFFFWRDPFDPFFKRLEWWRVLFPNGTGCDPDDWNQFAIRQNWTVTKLWQVSEQGQGPNWDGKAVVGAIRRAQVLQPQSQQAEGMEIQKMLNDCDTLVSARSDTIRTVSIFTREYDNKWSWHMIEEDAAMQVLDRENGGTEEFSDVPRFMYAAPRLYDSPWEILAPFIYEIGEGSINAFSGLGKQLFQLLQSKDIIEMGMLDGVILRQYPMLQPLDAGSAQRASLLQLGPMHVLSPGVQVVQTNLMADLEGSLAVMQHLEQQIESNTAIFKPRVDKPRGNPETATSANLRWQNATVLMSSAVDCFYSQGDRWIGEVWRRATADLPKSSKCPGIVAAREFQECCKERGVPMEVLRKPPYSIHLARSMGNGSPVARQQAVSAMTPLVPEMGPRGRRAYFKMYTSAFAGSKATEKLWPESDILELPDMNTWVAAQENDSMGSSGAEPIIVDSMDHRVHAKSHLMAAQAGLQAAQQGGDPVRVLTFIPVALAHTAKHVAALPKDEQKVYVQAITQIHGAYQELAAAYQQAQEQQAKNQQKAAQLTFEQQLKAMQVQHEVQIKEVKNAAQMQQRAERHEQDRALSDASTAAEIQRQTASTATSIATETASTAASIELDRRATDAKIENERRKAEAQAQAAVIAARNKPKPATK